MTNLQRQYFQTFMPEVNTIHADLGTASRAEAERFIQDIFARRYNARVNEFAPNLMLIEQRNRTIAATGWRSAGGETLFLERYLDQPIEQAMSKWSQPPVTRSQIVEVGHLASQKPGGSVMVFRELAKHLSQLGFEWVVFTATQELIGIFAKLGLPLLALAAADPSRLGQDTSQWGTYYDTQPIVVAGRLKLGVQRMEGMA